MPRFFSIASNPDLVWETLCIIKYNFGGTVFRPIVSNNNFDICVIFLI